MDNTEIKKENECMHGAFCKDGACKEGMCKDGRCCGWGGHGMWGGWKHRLIKLILLAIVLLITFSFGVKIGEFKAEFRGYFNGNAMYGGHSRMMPYGYYGQNGMMPYGYYYSAVAQPSGVKVPAGTSTKPAQ